MLTCHPHTQDGTIPAWWGVYLTYMVSPRLSLYICIHMCTCGYTHPIKTSEKHAKLQYRKYLYHLNTSQSKFWTPETQHIQQKGRHTMEQFPDASCLWESMINNPLRSLSSQGIKKTECYIEFIYIHIYSYVHWYISHVSHFIFTSYSMPHPSIYMCLTSFFVTSIHLIKT